MNEFELISRLTQSLPANASVVTGPGDDCAVLDLGAPDRLVLFKTDAVVEGVHFTPREKPELIGRKALARAGQEGAGRGTCLLVLERLSDATFDRDVVCDARRGEVAEIDAVGPAVGQSGQDGRGQVGRTLASVVPDEDRYGKDSGDSATESIREVRSDLVARASSDAVRAKAHGHTH